MEGVLHNAREYVNGRTKSIKMVERGVFKGSGFERLINSIGINDLVNDNK